MTPRCPVKVFLASLPSTLRGQSGVISVALKGWQVGVVVIFTLSRAHGHRDNLGTRCHGRAWRGTARDGNLPSSSEPARIVADRYPLVVEKTLVSIVNTPFGG